MDKKTVMIDCESYSNSENGFAVSDETEIINCVCYINRPPRGWLKRFWDYVYMLWINLKAKLDH